MGGWDRLAAELNVEGLQIAMGGSRRLSSVVKFGANFAITAASTPVSLTTAVINTLYPYPTAAEVLEVLSDQAADDAVAVGAGMWTIDVLGLDADWNLQTKTVIMDGANPVTVEGTWRRVFRLEGMTAGALLHNLGNIIARPSGGGDTRCHMPATFGQSMHCLFTIPDGYVGFFAQARANSLPSQTTPAPHGHVALVTRDNDAPNRPFRVRNTAGLPVQGRAVIPRLLQSKTDIELRVLEVDVNFAQISGSFDLLLRGKEEDRHTLPDIID